MGRVPSGKGQELDTAQGAAHRSKVRHQLPVVPRGGGRARSKLLPAPEVVARLEDGPATQELDWDTAQGDEDGPRIGEDVD